MVSTLAPQNAGRFVRHPDIYFEDGIARQHVPHWGNEDMIQTVASDRADEAFHERILPRAVGGREHFEDPHIRHALPEGVAVDRVAIAEEIGRRGVLREGVHDLLGRPFGGGMLGHVEVQNAPPMVGEHDQDEQHAPMSGWHCEEIDRDQVADMVGEELRQVCDGGVRRFGISLETVRSATSIPSFHSSPWIRGAPHSRFASAILVTRAVISALIGGRPAVALKGAQTRVHAAAW
jgi:hypothetical protein